jgi:tRNA(Arg) A34 adenosine deaminase TadA
LATTDITAHAEITALRAGCHRSGQILLEDAVVATTCEPCPMCLSALHWARVNVVYFGASIADAGAAGFHELRIPAADMVRRGGSRLKIDTGVLAAECRELFAEWKLRPDHRAY